MLSITSLIVLGCQTNEVDKMTHNSSFSKLNEVIKESFEIEDRVDGNLNYDEFNDEIYVIRYNKSERRSLVICLGTAADEYELFLNSSICVLPASGDEYNVDPFVEIKTSEGKFALVHIQKNNASCRVTHEFSYDKAINQFFLTQVGVSCHLTDENSSGGIVRNSTDFGKVNLFDFNIRNEY